MTRNSIKSNKLRNVNTVRDGTGNEKREIYYVKIKVIALIIFLDETNPFEIDKCKSKNGASVFEALALLIVIQVEKYDLPCLQRRDCQYLKDRLDS